LGWKEGNQKKRVEMEGFRRRKFTVTRIINKEEALFHIHAEILYVVVSTGLLHSAVTRGLGNSA
jgi:hypothetical protein